MIISASSAGNRFFQLKKPILECLDCWYGERDCQGLFTFRAYGLGVSQW